MGPKSVGSGGFDAISGRFLEQAPDRSSPEKAPRNEPTRYRHEYHYQQHVECCLLLLTEGVESHGEVNARGTRWPRGAGDVRRYAAANRRRCVTSDSLYTIEDRGPVRHLTIQRPQQKNSIPDGGWEALAVGFEAFESSDARVLVITGAGGDFSSGAELTAGTDLSNTVANHKRMRRLAVMATRLHRLSKPTIAVVDGVAVGAGMNLALGCDIVIGTERARFAEIFVLRGLTLDAGGTWLLPRIVGELRARELALTGRVVGAEEAATIGLITELVDSSDIDGAVDRHVAALLASSPLAQRFIKVGLDRSTSMTFEQALAWETQAQSILLAGDDFTEAVAAFLQRRDTHFNGD